MIFQPWLDFRTKRKIITILYFGEKTFPCPSPCSQRQSLLYYGIDGHNHFKLEEIILC